MICVETKCCVKYFAVVILSSFTCVSQFSSMLQMESLKRHHPKLTSVVLFNRINLSHRARISRWLPALWSGINFLLDKMMNHSFAIVKLGSKINQDHKKKRISISTNQTKLDTTSCVTTTKSDQNIGQGQQST